MSSFNLVDNSDECKNELANKVALALAAIGEKAEGYAKDNCPVDTGRLRNSITYSVQEDTCYIGTNVEYAPQQEFNDHLNHTTGQAHFLRDAASTHGDEYKNIAETILKTD